MMNRLLFAATLLVLSSSGSFAQNYNPKFDPGPDLKEFVKAATEDPALQINVPYPLIVVEAAKTISLKDKVLPSLRKEFFRASAGSFYNVPALIHNNVTYPKGLTYVPLLQNQEHPTAYKLLAQWEAINTDRGELLDEANVIDPKDRALYAEAVQLDQNAAALNQERDKLNAEITQYNHTCIGVQYPPSYCPSWSARLDWKIADLKRRVDIHNGNVDNWRTRKKKLDGEVDDFGKKIIAWEKFINDFISKAAAYLKDTGDCTPVEHYQLQQVVNTACSPAIIRACKKGQDCGLLFENLRKFEACIKARKEINNKCFKGGDQGHIDQITYMTNGANNCRKIINEDCVSFKGGMRNGEEGFRKVVFETAD